MLVSEPDEGPSAEASLYVAAAQVHVPDPVRRTSNRVSAESCAIFGGSRALVSSRSTAVARVDMVLQWWCGRDTTVGFEDEHMFVCFLAERMC